MVKVNECARAGRTRSNRHQRRAEIAERTDAFDCVFRHASSWPAAVAGKLKPAAVQPVELFLTIMAPNDCASWPVTKWSATYAGEIGP